MTTHELFNLRVDVKVLAERAVQKLRLWARVGLGGACSGQVHGWHSPVCSRGPLCSPLSGTFQLCFSSLPGATYLGNNL